VKLFVIAFTAATLSGCHFWYKPVPVANAIGEEKTVLAKDTVNVHREDRFEVYGSSSEAVYDGYEQLNRAYRAFDRLFGPPVPRLAIVMSGDSAVPLDSATIRSFGARGFTLVRYVRPRSFRSPSRYGALGYGGVQWPVAPTAARAMLARFADTHLDPDGARSDSALLDRFPLWYRASVIHMVGESVPANDIELVREKRGQLLPIQELLRLVRPASADSTLDPSRRSDTDEYTRIFAAQSTTIARFLVEREGPGVIGRLGRGYLAGRTLSEMMAEMRSTPQSVQQLEQRWRLWLDSRTD
jgi:hypothetical protein